MQVSLFYQLTERLTNREDLKLDNIFINVQKKAMRFSEVQLGDLGNCSPSDTKHARDDGFAGVPVWVSPEILLSMPWNTATDIWSFGALVCLTLSV